MSLKILGFAAHNRLNSNKVDRRKRIRRNVLESSDLKDEAMQGLEKQDYSTEWKDLA